MKFLKQVMTLGLFALSAVSHAGTFSFSGNLQSQKDVIYIPFKLAADATNVKVWTDSYNNGGNFDPITAVWRANGALVDQNDDNSGIAPGQTLFDSGLTFASLMAGDYIFTITTYNNFSNTGQLADGFRFDGLNALSLQDWCNCGMGSLYNVHLDNVTQAIAPAGVPEPGTSALLLAGLAGAGLIARRRKAG